MTSHVLIVEREHPSDLEVYRAAIAQALPDVVVHTAADEAGALAHAEGCSVLIAKAHNVSAELVRAMPRLDWVQALTTGTDHLDTVGLAASVVVTSARGVHGPQMSELAFLMMIALLRDYPRMQANQKAAVWARWPQRLLYGKTAVLVGVGTISEALAVRCKAFGMTVIGVSSTPRPAPGFDRIVAYGELAQTVAQADVVVLLCPYSSRTHHLIDAAILGAMKPTAFLVNIARGKVVDQAALVEALRAGRIAGAGLDVFETEPLPVDDPLWAMPNVIVTPRIGGMSDCYAEQLSPLIVENLAIYGRGDRRDLKNLVSGT